MAVDCSGGRHHSSGKRPGPNGWVLCEGLGWPPTGVCDYEFTNVPNPEPDEPQTREKIIALLEEFRLREDMNPVGRVFYRDDWLAASPQGGPLDDCQTGDYDTPSQIYAKLKRYCDARRDRL